MHGFDLELEPGLTLLEVPSPRSTAVHRLVCRHLADADGGSSYWIDAHNTASTHVLYDCASSPRVLEGLHVARAFTAYQHHSLVRAVVGQVDDGTTLVVAPNVASLYRDADLAEWEREDLRAATLETLSELGAALGCPVLVTAAREEDAATIADYAETSIECVRTREGLRLEGESGAVVEGYWHGRYWQTTIPYWVECCGAVEGVDPVVDAHDRGLLEVTA